MEWIVPILSTLVGFVIGSFLNVVIFRFNQPSLTVFKPSRSHLPELQKADSVVRQYSSPQLRLFTRSLSILPNEVVLALSFYRSADRGLFFG